MFRRSSISILLLSTLLLSCSSLGKVDCQGEWSYHPEAFSSDQKEWIRESAERWNAWVGYKIVSVYPGHKESCSINAMTLSPRKIGIEHSQTFNIEIDVDHFDMDGKDTKEIFEGVVMHELGHGFGFPHIGNVLGDALMSPMGALDFTDIDRMTCIKLGICNSLTVE